MCKPLNFSDFGKMKTGIIYRIISLNKNIDEIMKLKKIVKKDSKYYFYFHRVSNDCIAEKMYVVVKGMNAESNKNINDDNIIYLTIVGNRGKAKKTLKKTLGVVFEKDTGNMSPLDKKYQQGGKHTRKRKTKSKR